jgi:uncharacterized membrane protein
MELIQRVVYALVNLHPWHTLAVHFPIALSAVALLGILLALWRRSDFFERLAFVSMAIVAAGTAVSGLTGLRDNLFHFDGAAPYVEIKIFLGVSLLALTALTVIGRWRNPQLLWSASSRWLYVAAYLGSFLLAVVLGFVGGAIVYGF